MGACVRPRSATGSCRFRVRSLVRPVARAAVRPPLRAAGRPAGRSGRPALVAGAGRPSARDVAPTGDGRSGGSRTGCRPSPAGGRAARRMDRRSGRAGDLPIAASRRRGLSLFRSLFRPPFRSAFRTVFPPTFRPLPGRPARHPVPGGPARHPLPGRARGPVVARAVRVDPATGSPGARPTRGTGVRQRRRSRVPAGSPGQPSAALPGAVRRPGRGARSGRRSCAHPHGRAHSRSGGRGGRHDAGVGAR